jgi:hypothetical protein
VVGVVGLDFHGPIIGPQGNKPKSIHQHQRRYRRPAALQVAPTPALPCPTAADCDSCAGAGGAAAPHGWRPPSREAPGACAGNKLCPPDNVVFGTDK